jgi:hypothetical protein
VAQNAAQQVASTASDINSAAQQVAPVAADLATGGITRRFNENLQGVAQDIAPYVPPGVLDSMQTIQDLNTKYTGTPGAQAIPLKGQAPLTLSVDPSVMTPEDQQRYQQAQAAVGGTLGGDVERAPIARPPATGPLSVQDLAATLKQYPEDVQAGLRDFVDSQTQAGVTGKEINDTLRQYVSDNPPPSAAGPATPEAPAAAEAPVSVTPAEASPVASVVDDVNAAAKPSPPLETLTSGETPPRAAPEPVVDVGPSLPSQGPIRRILSAPGEAASRLGSMVSSALNPVENLPADTAGVLKNYANMVGKQSDAARVMAENRMRTAGADLSIPAVQDEVSQMRGELRNEAAQKLVSELQAQGKAAPIGDAPAGWRTVTDNPNTYLSNYAFSPDVVAPIKAVTDAGLIASNPLGGAILRGVGTAKGTLFSLSNFHTVTEGLNAAFTSPQTGWNFVRALGSDSFAQGMRGDLADTFDAAARAGVTGLAEHARPEDVEGSIVNALGRRAVASGAGGLGGAAAGYTETKLSGGTEEEARGNALKAGIAGAALAGVPLGARGTVPEILQSGLWERAVPIAKATAWDALQKSGLDPQQAATVVNERFGGLNYAAMGRNPTLMDATRLLAQAPDWNEATVRQLGSAVFGGSGQGVRAGFLAKTIAGMMFTTEALNYALSGHSTLQNQSGHQFEVEMQSPGRPGEFIHFGVMPGNLQTYLNLGATVATDPAKRGAAVPNFIANRMGILPSTLGDVSSMAAGKPPFQIAKAGPIAIGENIAPIGISQALQSTLRGGFSLPVSAGLALAGANPRYSKATGEGSSGFTAPESLPSNAERLTSTAERTKPAEALPRR